MNSSDISMDAKAKQNFSKCKTKFFKVKKKIEVEKILNIIFILRHCIYFEALYLFRDIFMPRKRIYLYPVKTNGESAGLFFL